MPYSFIQYSAGGSTAQFAIPFPYISRDHVKVYIDGVEDEAKTFASPSIVQTSTTPVALSVVEVRRATPKETPVVDFSDASTLTARNLDNIALQFLYLSQEAQDTADTSLLLASDGTYNALNRRIKNVGTPSSSADAATKAYVDTGLAGLMAATTAEADRAEAEADDAETSATAAAVSEGNAEAQVGLAAAHVATAAGHVTSAEGFRDEAEGFRDECSTSAIAAAASALEAAGYTSGFVVTAELTAAVSKQRAFSFFNSP